MPFLWVDQATLNWITSTLSGLDRKVTKLLPTLNRMETDMAAMDDAIAALTMQVSANTDAEQSAVALIQNLATLIQQNASDPAAINDLAAKLKASADALAGAVMANTPAT